MHRFFRSFMFVIMGLTVLLTATKANAQSNPPAWTASASFAIGDQAQLGGNVFRCIKAVGPNAASPVTNFTNWELSLVRSNTTLMIGVGQTFANFTSAWNYALNCRVADGTFLHFFISSAGGPFSQTSTTPFILDHSSGPRMAILGDNVTNDVFSFTTNGIVVDTGHSFNTISGVTIQGGLSSITDGISVNSDASVSDMSNVAFTGFGIAVSAAHNGTVTISSNCTIGGYDTLACRATFGGFISASGLSVVSPGASSGFLADEGGMIFADNSNASGGEFGFTADRGGYIEMENAIAHGQTESCISDTRNATVDAENASLTSAGTALSVANASTVDITGGTINGGLIGINGTDRAFVNAENAVFGTSSETQINVNDGAEVDAFRATVSSTTQGGSADASFVFGT